MNCSRAVRVLLGLATDRELCEFVNLIFGFGPGFHDRPGFEWVARVAAQPPDPTRADRLRAEATRIIEARARPSTGGS